MTAQDNPGQTHYPGDGCDPPHRVSPELELVVLIHELRELGVDPVPLMVRELEAMGWRVEPPPHQCPGGPAVEHERELALARCQCGVWFDTTVDAPSFPPHTVSPGGLVHFTPAERASHLELCENPECEVAWAFRDPPAHHWHPRPHGPDVPAQGGPTTEG